MFGYGSALGRTATVVALVVCVVRGRALSRRQRITRSPERARAVLHDHTTLYPFHAIQQFFKMMLLVPTNSRAFLTLVIGMSERVDGNVMY